MSALPPIATSIAYARAKMFQAVCKLSLEGIVSKNLGALYKSGPSKAWLKSKIRKHRYGPIASCGALAAEAARSSQTSAIRRNFLAAMGDARSARCAQYSAKSRYSADVSMT